MTGRRIAGRTALFLLAGLVACSGPRSTPEGAVQSFLDALAEGDTARFEASFTDENQALVAEIESLSGVLQGAEGALTIEQWCRAFCGGTVEGSTLYGDSAMVQVRVSETVEEIPLVRREDGWRIDFTSRLDEAVSFLRLAASMSDTLSGMAGTVDTTAAAGGPGVDTIPPDTAAP